MIKGIPSPTPIPMPILAPMDSWDESVGATDSVESAEPVESIESVVSAEPKESEELVESSWEFSDTGALSTIDDDVLEGGYSCSEGDWGE